MAAMAGEWRYPGRGVWTEEAAVAEMKSKTTGVDHALAPARSLSCFCTTCSCCAGPLAASGGPRDNVVEGKRFIAVFNICRAPDGRMPCCHAPLQRPPAAAVLGLLMALLPLYQPTGCLCFGVNLFQAVTMNEP